MYDLILFITNKCNLRCDYCLVKKGRDIMSYKVAKESVDYYLKKTGQKKHIRFFGGEPFLSFGLIKKIVKYANQQAKKYNQNLTFDISTNGTLLSKNKLDFFRKNNNVELILSLDGTELSHLINRKSNVGGINSHLNILKYLDEILKIDNLCVNTVLAPNQVANFSRNFLYLVKVGFRHFNFLPAYYLLWKMDKQKELKKQLNMAARIIKTLRIKTGVNIKIKNERLKSKTPLFNQGLIVDCSGDAFFNNLFMTKYFYDLKKENKIGHISDFAAKSGNQAIKNGSLMIKEYLDSDIYKSTMLVDTILTDFVNKLRKGYS